MIFSTTGSTVDALHQPFVYFYFSPYILHYLLCVINEEGDPGIGNLCLVFYTIDAYFISSIGFLLRAR